MASGSELLVRLDTSALESRLHGLTDQWEGQVRGMRSKVEDCTASVRAVSADVASIQQFLLSYHNREMSSVLTPPPRETVNGGAKAIGGAAEGPAKSAGAPSDGASTENLLKMVSIARRLLADNEALRTSLDNATAALASYNITHESLEQEVVRLRELTTSQSERLQSMSDWLGMSGLPVHSGEAAEKGSGGTAATSPDDDGGMSSSSSPHDASAQSTEAVLARSPLLLSFRRFLLRDLTERLTSVVDQQSKDFHDSVAHLEGRIQTGQCIVTGVEAQAKGDASGDLLETVQALSRRLKELDQRVVKRDEFTSLMRSKADSLLLPVKADSAAVSEMERRLAARCADLEERTAYADAERAEFRAILRSLIAAQSAPANVSRPSGRTSPDPSASAASPRKGGSERSAVLRDVLPTLSHSPYTVPTTSSKPQSFYTPRGAASSSPPPQHQLYRVVGAAPQGLGVLGVPAGGAASTSGGGGATTPVETTVRSTSGSRREFGGHPQSTPAGPNEEAPAVIGMTSSQGDYANFVSQQLSRKQVAALPTLPYERLTNSP